MGIRIVFVLLVACGGGGGGGGGHDAPSGSEPVPSDGGVDTGGGTDAAVGPLCMGTVCTGTDVCCLGATTLCKPAAMCPSQSFACDGPEDCPSGQCCYGNGGQGGSQCRASCAAPACHVDGDCPSATPKCCPKTFTPMYKVCQTAC
jgi:hypothetical protein